MRWFKHFSNSQDDEALAELISEFGAEGYGLWWIILEKIALQIKQKPTASVRYSAKKWANFGEVSVVKLRKVINLLEKKMPSFEVLDDGKYITISCPNILKYCDEWTQRLLKKSSSLLGSNSGASTEKTRHEVEVEVEEEKNKEKKKDKIYGANFLIFWKAYPRKKNKGQAEKAFLKIKPDKELLQTILAGIEQAKKSHDWQKDNGQFIPHPATWLNARGWEDEIELEIDEWKELREKYGIRNNH